MGFATDNGKGMSVTAPTGSILSGGKALSVVTLGPGNYEFLELQSDGNNFRVVAGTRNTLATNGLQSRDWPGNWLYPSTAGYLLSRFSEPSSYAGLGAVLALAGLHFSDTDLGQAAQFLAAGCGLAALLLKERGLIQALLGGVLLSGTLNACAPLVAAGAAAGAAGGGLAIANQVAGAVDTTIQVACKEYQKGRIAANAVVGAGLPSGITAKRNMATPLVLARRKATPCRPQSGSANWSARSAP